MKRTILEGLRSALLDRTTLTSLPDSVWKRSGALNTWGTNAIEGNTLTWDDVEDLLYSNKTPANNPFNDVLETIQHEKAFRELLVRIPEPIRLTTVLELHEAVFRLVMPEAGMWRFVNVRVAGSTHRPPRAEKVIPMMTEWEQEYAQREREGTEVFALGAWMHQSFESIHPFSDGNGRVGRLLLNLHFLKHSWPPVHVLPTGKEDYINALEEGHTGDLSPLEGFLRVLMGRSLLDLLDQLGGPKDEMRSISSLAEDGPYGAKYLALRAMQGVLPAVKTKNAWHTSARAIDLYREAQGRK